MTIAVGVFVWQARESRQEAIAGTSLGSSVQRTRTIPAERYELLARFDPPAPPAETGGNTALAKAGARYSARDYAAAAAQFRAIDSPEARYYAGISALLAGDRDAGMADLQAVIASGAEPYQEPAHFYLAKALLGGGDIAGARSELEKVAAMRGPLEKQAQVLKAQIGK